MILGCCVIFNLPCWSDEAGTRLSARGKRSRGRFYNHRPQNQTPKAPLGLLPSHQLLSTSFEPCRASPAHLSSQNRRGKLLHGRCEPSQGLLLLPSCCRASLSAELCPFHGSLQHWIHMSRNKKKWLFSLSFFPLLKQLFQNILLAK